MEVVITVLTTEEEDGQLIPYTQVYRYEFDTEADLNAALAYVKQYSISGGQLAEVTKPYQD